MSFGIHGSLQTTFKIQNKKNVKNKPDAATLTLHALYWLKRPQNKRKYVRTSARFSKSGGLIGQWKYMSVLTLSTHYQTPP